VFVLIAAAGVLVPGRAWAQTMQADLFNDDTLQEIRLVVSTRNWEALKTNYLEDTYYPADLVWKNVTVRNVGIRSRGVGTRNGVKPGLRVDFNRYLTNQTFLGLKAIALDNQYSDTSVVREAVTMKMFARMGLPVPREVHVRLYVNNTYAGVYTVIESIDRDFITRVFGAAEGNVETGGYLYEYTHLVPWGFESLGDQLDPYAVLFEAETHETASIVSLYQPIADMVQAVNTSADEDFASATGAYLDLRLVMTHLAVESFMAEFDGLTGFYGVNNFYFYRFREGLRGQLLPWDKDRTFYAVDQPIMLRFETNVLVRRAMQVPELRQAFFDALAQCATIAMEPDPTDPRGWLEREVDRQTSQVAPAIADDPVYPFTPDQVQADFAALLAFARTRAAFVSCEATQAQAPAADQPDCHDVAFTDSVR
jgi:hypothetical protein